jgi:hypothetical protein
LAITPSWRDCLDKRTVRVVLEEPFVSLEMHRL